MAHLFASLALYSIHRVYNPFIFPNHKPAVQLVVTPQTQQSTEDFCEFTKS